MKKYIFFILIIFLSCNHYENSNFHNLYSSFSVWYNKHHPINNGNINSYDNYIKIKRYDALYDSEYFEDLKRFKFELSQVSIYNLNIINKKRYYTIDKIIDHLIFDFNDSQLFVNVSDHLLLNIYNHFLKIYFSNNLNNNERVNTLSDLFKDIPVLIDRFKKKIMYSDVKLINYNPNSFDQIELLLNNFFIIFDLNDSDLDHINSEIDSFIVYLLDFKKWINKRDITYNELDDQFLNKRYQNLISNISEYKNSMKFLEFQVISVQNELFEQVLPIYRVDNDEPVWVDRLDTLDIIRAVLKSNDREIIKDFDSSLIDFENSFNANISFLNKSIGIKKNMNFNFNFYIKEDFSLEKEYFKLLNNLNFENLNLLIDANYQYEYLENSIKNEFIIEEVVLSSFINSKASLDGNFALEENIYGLRNIISKIFIMNGFDSIDDKYNILIKLKELDLYLKILAKHYYFIDKYSNEKILEYLDINSFYNNSEHVFLEILNPQKYYLDDYFLLMKINELYDQNCIINNVMNSHEFLTRIIDMKSIPYNKYDEFFN